LLIYADRGGGKTSGDPSRFAVANEKMPDEGRADRAAVTRD